MLLTAFVSFLIFLIFLILLFILLLAAFPVKAAADLNSGNRIYMNIVLSWLNPFLKGFITSHDGSTTLTINLFNGKVLKKDFSNEKSSFIRSLWRNYMNYLSMAESLSISNAKLYASYGFPNPAVTGVICGAIGFITQYVNIDELYNNADFLTDSLYFNIKAKAEINAAATLLKIIRRRILYKNPHPVGSR